MQHFKPKRHEFIEMGELINLKKANGESVCEFLLKIRKKSEGLCVSEDMIKAIFLNGLDGDIQKHIALRKAFSMEELIEAATEFEKITNLSNVASVNTIRSKESELKILKEGMIQLQQRLDEREALQMQERYGDDFQEDYPDMWNNCADDTYWEENTEKLHWQQLFDMMEEILYYVKFGEMDTLSNDQQEMQNYNGEINYDEYCEESFDTSCGVYEDYNLVQGNMEDDANLDSFVGKDWNEDDLNCDKKF